MTAVAVQPGTEPIDAELIRLAVHEAAHALVAIRFGRDLKAVTIEDHDGFGCCYSYQSVDGLRAPEMLEMSSMLLWPLGTRQLFERGLAMAAAGRVAEQVYAPDDARGYRPPPPDEAVRTRIIDELHELGYARLVEKSAPDFPLQRQSDEERISASTRLGVSRAR
jgi:hypothetical protein